MAGDCSVSVTSLNFILELSNTVLIPLFIVHSDLVPQSTPYVGPA